MKFLSILAFLPLITLTAFAETPAEVSIRRAEEQIATKPPHAPYYNSLAMAYARRARETSDVAFYQKAEETLDRAASVSPDDFETGKTRVWLMLGRHEFAKALEAATKLNSRRRMTSLSMVTWPTPTPSLGIIPRLSMPLNGC